MGFGRMVAVLRDRRTGDRLSCTIYYVISIDYDAITALNESWHVFVLALVLARATFKLR